MRQFSIVTRINIALACIVTLAVGTMLASYWLSDKTDNKCCWLITDAKLPFSLVGSTWG